MTESSAVAGGCPVTHGFVPFDESYLAAPYPFFNELREETPVAYAPNLDLYLVTRFDDIAAVLKNREVFSAANATIPFSEIAPAARAILDSGFPRQATFTNADAPRHTTMRSAASKCLTRARWKSAESAITRYLDERLAELEGRETIELSSELICPTTSYAGFSLLGFPPEDTEKLFGWCSKRILLTYGQLDEADQVVAAQNLVDFWNYIRDFVHMRTAEPADDLTSDLLAVARDSEGKVTVEDVVNMVYSLSLASHETTANAMLNGIYQLMRHRDAWDALVADKSLIPGAVEELLRFDSPTITHRRLCKQDTQIGGVDIPAGATVMLVLASGNHDPRRFEDPEELDVTRPNAVEHLAFGKNWHFCLGAPLARFEVALVLDRLTTRMPNMVLANEAPPNYAPIVLFRALDRLVVKPAGRN